MPYLTEDDRIGTLVGNYRLDRVLGKGGMGVVFAATHHRIGALRAAVKFLQPHWAQDADIVERFLREAHAAALLKHPNVCAVSDVGITDDRAPYMILEFLDGQSLSDLLEERKTLSPQELYRYLGPVMTAVAYAHDQNVVHRDLKPDNIFISRSGSEMIPKVLDFGIAKISIDQSQGKKTVAPIGTPLYMAPEQAIVKDVGPWCDVWSMGVIMYEALTGRFPFDFPDGADVYNLISIVGSQPPIAIAKRSAQVPAELCDVVDRALSRDPKKRYRHMRELDAAYKKALDRVSTVDTMPGGARPSSSTPYISSDLKTGELPGGGRSRLPWVALGGIGVAAVVGGIVAMAGGGPVTPAWSASQVAVPTHAVDRPPPTTLDETLVLPDAGTDAATLATSEEPRGATVPTGVDVPGTSSGHGGGRHGHGERVAPPPASAAAAEIPPPVSAPPPTTRTERRTTVAPIPSADDF